jgi:hypothetical protein
MGLGMKLPLTLIMTPIEIISKFTKPFALTIRLFANMVAGHVIILSLVGLIFLFGWLVALPVLGMSLFIMVLETAIVVPIQAFIFSLLAAVFIGQIRDSLPLPAPHLQDARGNPLNPWVCTWSSDHGFPLRPGSRGREASAARRGRNAVNDFFGARQ